MFTGDWCNRRKLKRVLKYDEKAHNIEDVYVSWKWLHFMLYKLNDHNTV